MILILILILLVLLCSVFYETLECSTYIIKFSYQTNSIRNKREIRRDQSKASKLIRHITAKP